MNVPDFAPRLLSLRAGATLVEASAGTGKTTALCQVFARLVVEKRLSVREILVVTFTRAAAAELRDRQRRYLEQLLIYVRSDAGDEGAGDPLVVDMIEHWRQSGQLASATPLLEQALAEFDLATISTIHGFCQRVLGQYVVEMGASSDELGNQLSDQLLLDLAHDYLGRLRVGAGRVETSLLQGVKVDALHRLTRSVLGFSDVQVAAIPSSEAADLALLRRFEEVVTRLADCEDARIGQALASAAKSWPKSTYRSNFVSGWVRTVFELQETFHPKSIYKAKEIKLAFLRYATSSLEPYVHDAESLALLQSEPFFQCCEFVVQEGEELAAAAQRYVARVEVNFVQTARERMSSLRKAAGVQSFDDLMTNVRDALVGPNGTSIAAVLRKSYRAALIDEFQDTDSLQYEIFSRIWMQEARGESFVLFVGDPKQAIYGFRGADIFAYLVARRQLDSSRYILRSNYRSHAQLISAVNHLFEQHPSPFALPEIDFTPAACGRTVAKLVQAKNDDCPPLRVEYAGAELAARAGSDVAVAWAVARVAELLDGTFSLERDDGNSRAVSAGDIAILCRRNADADAVYFALSSAGVPAVLGTNASIFETLEAEQLQALLLAAASPGSASSLKLALLTSLFGYDVQGVERLCADDASWEALEAARSTWLSNLLQHGVSAWLLHLLLHEKHYRTMRESAQFERRLTNFLHLAEVLDEVIATQGLGIDGLLVWFARARRDPAAAEGAVERVTTLVRLESESRSVEVLTIHKSKGLQYPIVLCPFVGQGDSSPLQVGWEGEHVQDEAGYRLQTYPFEAPAECGSLREGLSEDLRLLYVLLTRAESHCGVFLRYLEQDVAEQEPSAKKRRSKIPLNGWTYLVHLGQASRLGNDFDLEALQGCDPLADLQAIEAASGQVVGVREFVPGSSQRDASLLQATAEPELRDWQSRDWVEPQLHSFTSISGQIASSSDGRENQKSEARDLECTPSAWQGIRSSRQVGTVLHEMLERLVEASSPEIEKFLEMPRVRRVLGISGDDAAVTQRLAQGIADVMSAPLGGPLGETSLQQIPRESRYPELSFVFSMQPQSGSVSLQNVRAAILAESGAPELVDYAQSMIVEETALAAGFVRGAIDLAFQAKGRWYVADYKSNDLGPSLQDYHADAVRQSMDRGSYWVQGLIYALALYRCLRAGNPAFDYEQEFGGVCYLYIRGMSAGLAPGWSTCHFRPSLRLIRELDGYFGDVGAVQETGETLG